MQNSQPIRVSVWKAGIVLLAVLTCVCLVIYFGNRPDSNSVGITEDSPARLEKPSPPSQGYVGALVCAECHAEIAESFSKHPMGRSARHVSLTLDAPNDSALISFSPSSGLEYSINRSDDRVVHEEVIKDKQGQVLAKQSVPVDFVIGSGKHGRSYVTNHDGILLLSPISWYSQKNDWSLAPRYEPFRHARFERRATGLCLRCHVGRVNPTGDSPDRFRNPVFHELSIGCENCHGPGQSHVEFQKKSNSEGKDPIVSLSSLNNQLQTDVCLQCHLTGSGRVLRYGRSPFDFRPGMNLTDVFCVTMKSEHQVAGGEDSRAVSQVEQLFASACYQKSAGKMTCTTCHSPHSVPNTNDRVTYFRKKCLQCHNSDNSRCNLPAVEQERLSPGQSCIVCHMPRATASDVPHTALTDHRILKKPQAQGILSQPGNNAREIIYGAEISKLPEISKIRAFAILQAMRAKRTGSVTEAQAAMRSLQYVFKAAPDDHEVMNALAICAQMLGKSEDAETNWLTILASNPNDERALAFLAYSLLDRRQYKSAVQRFDRLISINPWVADIHMRRSMALAGDGRLGEALIAGEKGLALNPTEPRYYRWMQDIYEKNGHNAKAGRLRIQANQLSQILRESKATLKIGKK